MSERIKPTVGDQLKDNDPRMGNRVLTVTRIDRQWVWAKDNMGHEFRYGDHRIMSDGKPRRSGLSLIRKDQP